jgi:CheY-like chemotaxis protein/signal transduction histidine kinase/HAMP domain-containing protein
VNLLAANLTNQVRAIADVATAVSKGDLTRSIRVEARGEVAELKDNINTMIGNLRLTTERNTEQDWLKTNLARFTGMLQGQRDLATVGKLILSELVPLVGAHQGVIYQLDREDGQALLLLAAYGHPRDNGYPRRVEFGEGFLGQCAADRRRILITSVPADTVPVGSVLFQALPRSVVVYPIVFEGQIRAVLGLATLDSFAPAHLSFLEQLTASLGIVLNSIEATMQTESLLQQSQQLAGELQAQQKELQQTNEQLGLKAQQLAEQNAEVERKNQEIEQARRALEEKAAELALTSKYKSEFLANMSHELRTPLNSILILGQQLFDNPEGNLSQKQVEFARTIHGAGSDLLTLITDILDLSKIESGTVTIEVQEVALFLLLETVRRMFRHEAENRRLWFEVQGSQELEQAAIHTDSKRVLQVIKNLLSNAFKFTEKGGVNLNVYLARAGWSGDHAVLKSASAVVAFEVTDSGVGIPLDKQRIIFEAFQQADAGTSRKYGGTGLGLAISRELSNLLGGEIQLRSSPGKGSTFTLYLPLRYAGTAIVSEKQRQKPQLPQHASFPSEFVSERIPDDRTRLKHDADVLLIIESEPHYARVLVDLARGVGFQVLAAMRGVEALELVHEFRPTAIVLDTLLSDMLGWALLSQLKQDPSLRHVPVQAITLDEDRQIGLTRGAFAVTSKPFSADELGNALRRLRDYAQPRKKRLLIVEDDPAEQLAITELLGGDDVEIVLAVNGAEALEELRRSPCDCAVLDLRLPDMTGFDVLDRMGHDEKLRHVPVVIFTGRQLSTQEDERLRQYARSVVLKGVESPERLLDETALFLHRSLVDLPPKKREMIERLHRSDDDLQDKLVLVVDDDVRNIFALSSALEQHGMRALTAATGREAIELLQSTPEVSIVLMDVMMPEMDGFETMRAIRSEPTFRKLPILALTAKAMKGDREKCMEAGASDYLAKPVDTEQLLSALRMWLHR